MSGAGDGSRFTDPGIRLEILVRCPRCAGRACVLPDPSVSNPFFQDLRRRVQRDAYALAHDGQHPRGAGDLVEELIEVEVRAVPLDAQRELGGTGRGPSRSTATRWRSPRAAGRADGRAGDRGPTGDVPWRAWFR